MLSLIIGLLTLVLVLNSLLLILMVLVQLPKKEAGLGMAFGGATADALFGAGSGTVLSQWTKYAAGAFLILSLGLSVLRNHEHRSSSRGIVEQLGGQTPAAAVTTPLAMTNVVTPATDAVPAPATVTNVLPLEAAPSAELTVPVPAPAPAPTTTPSPGPTE
jgi:preprotein translocase subunit SecG